jgi:hypothetical protein
MPLGRKVLFAVALTIAASAINIVEAKPSIGVELQKDAAGKLKIIAISPGSPADKADLQVGEQILEVAREPVASAQEIVSILEEQWAAEKRKVVLLLENIDGRSYVVVELQNELIDSSADTEASADTDDSIDWGKLIVDSFETFGSDLSDIPAKTEGYTALGWHRTSVADVAAVGAGACAIPVGAYAVLPAESGYFMREIYNSTMGLGHLMYGTITEDDFPAILPIWSEAYSIDRESLVKMYEAAKAAVNDHGPDVAEEAVDQAMDYYSKQKKDNSAALPSTAASSQVVSKMVAKKSGAKTAGKLSTKVATKAGGKIATKYAAKGATAWIPVIGAAVCSSLNAWIMNDIMSVAWSYYDERKIAKSIADPE